MDQTLRAEKTALEVVKTFLKRKKQDRVSFQPRKRTWEIALSA